MSQNDLLIDVNLLKDPIKLQEEGALLVDTSTQCGRVIFSVNEIPVWTKFETSNNNFIQRNNNQVILITNRTTGETYKLKINNQVNSQNKDILIWAQSQSDLCTLSDSKKLKQDGAIIRDIFTGLTSKIHSLLDLSIGVKYFTENDNIIERISESEVKLGDRVLQIHSQKVIPNNQTHQGFLDFEVSKGGEITLGNDDDIITEDLKDIIDISTLLNSKDFPQVTKCMIEGTGFLGSPIKVSCNYVGGVEGNSIIRWEKCFGSGNIFTPIKGESSFQYIPTVDDVDARIRVSYTPVRADGITGLVSFSNDISVSLSPELNNEIKNNLSLGTLMLKVLLVNGSEFQKRSILLNKEQVKIRKRRSTITKMKYGKDLQVFRDANNDSAFVLEFSAVDRHIFLTPTPHQRDVIMLTIREFNKRHM